MYDKAHTIKIICSILYPRQFTQIINELYRLYVIQIQWISDSVDRTLSWLSFTSESRADTKTCSHQRLLLSRIDSLWKVLQSLFCLHSLRNEASLNSLWLSWSGMRWNEVLMRNQETIAHFWSQSRLVVPCEWHSLANGHVLSPNSNFYFSLSLSLSLFISRSEVFSKRREFRDERYIISWTLD